MASELEKLEMLDDELPLLAELSSLLRLVAKTRLRLVAFYERLFQVASSSISESISELQKQHKFVDFEAFRKEIREIKAPNDLEYHGCLRPIRTLIRQECIIVGGYIGCLAELDHWRFNIALAPVIPSFYV